MSLCNPLQILDEIKLTEKEYKVSYIVKNPPVYAKDNPEIWAEAFFEYLKRQGIKNPERLKVVDNVEWNKVVRIYNTLIGKKNRDRKDGHTKKKNKDLIAASSDAEKVSKKDFLPEYLTMIDCETTGVVFKRDALLQVAMVKLKLIDNQYKQEGKPLVLYFPHKEGPKNDFQKKYLTHIFSICNRSDLNMEEAKQKIKEWLGDIWGKSTPTGDCISFDMSVLHHNNLLDINDYDENENPIKGTFHYSQFDLNPIKLIIRQKEGAKPKIDGIDEENIHDALVDCYNQIKELNFYLKYFLKG